MGCDIEVAVIDGKSRLGNGLFLPSGPLRDSKNRLNSVDFIINNGSSLDGEISSQLEYKGFLNLITGEKKHLEFFRGRRCYAVAGIGKPNNFFSILEDLGIDIIAKPFPDHYQFKKEDLSFDNEYPILMTSKDCVKCSQFASSGMWYLDINAKIEPEFYHQLESKL
jgi:tetraacyldisaccharide 4'-kinase